MQSCLDEAQIDVNATSLGPQTRSMLEEKKATIGPRGRDGVVECTREAAPALGAMTPRMSPSRIECRSRSRSTPEACTTPRRRLPVTRTSATASAGSTRSHGTTVITVACCERARQTRDEPWEVEGWWMWEGGVYLLLHGSELSLSSSFTRD